MWPIWRITPSPSCLGPGGKCHFPFLNHRVFPCNHVLSIACDYSNENIADMPASLAVLTVYFWGSPGLLCCTFGSCLLCCGTGSNGADDATLAVGKFCLRDAVMNRVWHAGGCWASQRCRLCCSCLASASRQSRPGLLKVVRTYKSSSMKADKCQEGCAYHEGLQL